ncbi:MAG: Holliday junction resolvase RuvX [Gammaproteobacteria bacterium]
MPSGKPLILLGFDYGLKRIGVAVGQRLTGAASALTTVEARDGKPHWDTIAGLIGEWHPDALVVGIPRHMDGTAHQLTEAAERFARQLEGRFRLPTFRIDERLSSKAAETALAERSAERRGRQVHAKAEIDKLAAQIILQSWLDSRETTHDDGN